MKSIIDRIFSIKALVALMIICATSGAWATDSLEETGGFVTTSSQLAFKNATLGDLTADTLHGRFSGAWAGTAKGSTLTFNTFATPDANTKTCEAKLLNDGYIKGVLLTFTQNGDDVEVQMTGGKYLTGSDITASIASGSDGSYSVCHLRLSRTPELYGGATVTWEAGEFATTKVGIDGNEYTITLPASGLSIDETTKNLVVAASGATTGATIDISGANTQKAGVLIKYSSLAAVSDGVSLATAQAVYTANGDLVVAGARTTGSNVLTMKGYWEISNNSGSNYAFDTVPSLNAGSGYFHFYYNDSTDNSINGTFGYAGRSALTLAGGRNSGLKWTNASYSIKKVSVGGPVTCAHSGVKAWPNVVVEKVALFVGDKYTASDIAEFEFNPTAEATIDADGTYTLAGDNNLFDSIAADGEYVINVNEDATLNIPSATSVNMITFNVAANRTLTLTGNTLTAAGGIKVTGEGKVYTTAMSVLSGPIKGDGTLCYDMNNGTTKPTGLTCTKAAWKGVLWIKNGAYTGWQFSNFASDNSSLRLSNVECYINESGKTYNHVDLEGDGWKITNGNGYTVNTVKVLTGSGALYFGNGSANGNGLVVQDADDFSGAVSFQYTNRHRLTFGNSGTYGTDSKIVVSSGATATIATGKTWAPNAFEVNGTLAFSGAGKASGPVTTANGSTLDLSGFTGEAPAISGALTLVSGTTIKFPASAVWPYKVASSISGLTDGYTTLAAGNYTVGGVAGTSPLLLLSNGTAIPAAVLSVTGDTDWSTLADGCTQTAYVLNVTSSATLDIDSAVSGLDVIIFNVDDGCTLTLTGATITADSIRTVGTGSVALNTSGYDVSGLTEGGYVKVLDGVITGSVGVTAVPAASESLVYYYDIKSDGVYVRAIGKTRRSINANFGNTLSVETNVGIAGVPGNKWDNFSVNEGTTSHGTVKVVDDANSTTFNCPGLSVEVSGTRGTWNASYTAASDPRQTYIDDNATYTKPTVTITGVPFAKYRAIVYHSTDDNDNKKWGYDTVNGSNYYYDDQKTLQTGTSAWGSTSGVAMEEGVNILVTDVITDPSFVVSGNYHGGNSSARGCIAAVQIVKTDVATIASAGEYTFASLFGLAASTAGDYVINVNESATLNISSDTTVFMVTFNVAEGKTLTITGGTLTGTGSIYINGPGKVVTSTVGQLSGNLKTNAAGLSAGVYELRSWTTPQQYTTTCAGYGTWTVVTTGLASGLSAEPVYGAKSVYLRIYDTETQAARKPLVIWPYGDSITEGYNAQHTGTNYRILLYQKLRMLGYNVKSTGVYGLDDGYNSVDPSGTPLTDTDKWHSAKHGAPVSAGISGLAGRAALIENVDTLCVQAGTPDVVLLHIGVNDLSQTGDVDSVFEAWTNVVGRLVRNLPNSKIVVSTALYGRDNQTTRNSRVTSYNDKIKAKIADMPTEWVGHVVLADLCSLVDSNTTGILYSLDTVHPDWWGYDQMADGWLAEIVKLYGNPDATNFPSQAELPAIPDDSALGAANKSELDDYLVGFTKYGDIRVEHGQDIGNIEYDNVGENAAVSDIGRVGYFVEYVRDDNHAHKWVWVDMDAFGNRDIASIGLPAATQQHVVDHLHVYSNHGAIDNVAADDDTVKGFVEFTPYNIGAAASNIPGAPADSCPTSNQLDWNDTPSANGTGEYSSMQVFRIAPPSGRPAQTIFGFNNWRSFDTNPAEFGIGNFAQHFWSGSVQTLDYVHTRTSVKMNADAYTVKTIEIWTKPVYTATMSATGNFSGLEFSPTLPGDISECDLVVNVTDNATLTFDSDKSVGTITFNIAANKTLTLDGTSNLTVGKVVVSGPGKLAFTASPEFGALRIASNATIALASDQSITLTGALTVESGVALTMEPATMVALSSDMISAGSVVNNGTVALTAPDEGSDYSVSITGTAITLRRVTKNAFTYNPVPGENTPSGWITSWGGEPLATTSLRVGPSSDIPYVYHVASGKHPWVGLAARTSGFSYAIYADVSQMESDKGVITAFGNTGKGLFLYRDGDYVKLAHVVDGSITTPSWVPGVAVSAGYHLYTVTFDPTTGAAALYLDDGSTCAATDGSTHDHLGTQGLNTGFQLGSVYEGVGDTGFHVGAGLAVCAVRGYDVVLQPVEVETLSESFPATDGNVTWNVEPDNADNTVIVTSTTFGDSNYIGQSKGTLTIPAGSEVNVKHIRVLNNNSTSDRATVNIAGTLNITSTSTNPNTWADRESNKGVLFGHYHGQGTYNITGSLLAENTYIETVYTSEAQLLDISGGTVKTKALYAGNGNSTVKLRDGGTLEVAEILSTGSAITKEFKYGTFRVTADATETRAINFSAAGGYATTLDPYGNTLTLESAALTGTGDITVADSSVSGDGKVVFVGGPGYTGRLILTDANAANIDISDYTGTVLCQGTAAETIAMFDGFAGIVYFTGNVDATGIDLSGATVHIADDCTFTADAGSEGALVLGSGATVTLNVTEEVANYEGYFPTVSGSGTISYYQTDGTPGELTGVDHVNGNNLMPYYNVWVPSANGENNTISADAAARWRLGRLPDTNKNVAFKLSGDATVTIDATITFKDVQVYGTGTLTIQQSGNNVLTVGNGLYTTANAGIEIDSGLEFADYTKLEVESVLPKYVAVNCGTEESPFVIPTVTGSGMLYITADHALASVSLAVGSLYVDGSVAIYGSGSATTASVYVGGVIDVSSGTSLTVPTLTVNGTVTMGGNTLSATTVTGTGRVEYTNKLPDSSSWSTGTASSGWRGTVAVSGYVHSGNVNKVGWTVGDWGNTYSTLEVSNCAAWYVDNASAGPALKLAGDFQINDGGSAYVTVFASLSGSGTLTVSSGTSATHTIKFDTAEAFSGSIVNGKFKVVIGSSGGENSTISVDDSKVINLADGKSLQSTNIKISGTVNIAGAGALQGVVTINDGATLKFDDLSSDKKLTLSSTLAFASGMVNLAFSADSDKRAFSDGKVIIDWTTNNAIPAGNFAFSNASLDADWVLLKKADGLYVYSAKIEDSSEGDAGTVEVVDNELVATVEPTGTAVTINPAVTKLIVSVTEDAIANITAAGVAQGDVVVTYKGTDTTAAYKITKNGSNEISFDLTDEDPDTTTVGGVKIRPEVADTTPITYTTTTPVLNIKTIPGLWYAVASGSSLGVLVNGTPEQADGTTTALTAPAIGAGTVIYYKVKVGAKESDLEQ